MKRKYFLIGMAIRRCVGFCFPNKDIIFCFVSSHIYISGNLVLNTLLSICLVTRLVYPALILNIILTFFFSLYLSAWRGDSNRVVENKLLLFLASWQEQFYPEFDVIFSLRLL